MASAFLCPETKQAARARKAVHRALKENDRSRKGVLKVRKELRGRADRFLSTTLGAVVVVVLCAAVGALLGGTVAASSAMDVSLGLAVGGSVGVFAGAMMAAAHE